MKRIIFLIFLLIISLISTSYLDRVFAKVDEEAKKNYIVGFKSSINHSLIKAYRGDLKREYKSIPAVAVNLSSSAAINLASNIDVEYIEEDAKIQAAGQFLPWGITDVKATDVHHEGIVGSGIKVGIIDSGIDNNHEDLLVSGGTNFVDGSQNFQDDNGHGTHVAGTIAALSNEVGVLGVAPKTDLFAIKVLDQYGNGNYSDVIAGIDWAISNNIDIINISLTGDTDSRTLKRAVDRAYNAGILVIAAAGNNGYNKKGTIAYPAKYESVIAVGAINNMKERPTFSSVGYELDLMAPGVEIQSTIPNGYAYSSGTSMAAPHVAGIAALLLDANPDLTNVQLRDVIIQSAHPLGDAFTYGKGWVDAWEALKLIQTSNYTAEQSQ